VPFIQFLKFNASKISSLLKMMVSKEVKYFLECPSFSINFYHISGKHVQHFFVFSFINQFLVVTRFGSLSLVWLLLVLTGFDWLCVLVF